MVVFVDRAVNKLIQDFSPDLLACFLLEFSPGSLLPNSVIFFDGEMQENVQSLGFASAQILDSWLQIKKDHDNSWGLDGVSIIVLGVY